MARENKGMSWDLFWQIALLILIAGIVLLAADMIRFNTRCGMYKMKMGMSKPMQMDSAPKGVCSKNFNSK